MNKDVFGEAIKACFRGEKKVEITVKSDAFDNDIIPVSYLFRNFSEMPKEEQKALELSKGTVLDVGCGAGSHSLYLQNEKHLKVTSIDTSLGAIEICATRGVKNSICENFYSHNATYDTVLMLMNGSGIIGSLPNIDFFFQHLKNILQPNGQLLIDSSNLIYLYENENGEYWIDASQGYYGEMRYQLEYKNVLSEPFDWLYIDYNTLQNAANINGFECELIFEGEHYNYLARITIIQ